MIMTCVESLHCITEALKDSRSKEVKESLRVLNQFPEAFEDLDRRLSDPDLTDICRHLPELHFDVSKALIIRPVETIQNEYFERTGKTLTESFCISAYYTAKCFDIDYGSSPEHNAGDTYGQNSGQKHEQNSGQKICAGGY